MRKFLMGAAAAIAIAAPATTANADSGTIGVRYNNADAGGSDLDIYGVEGSFNHDFSNGWTVQADGASQRIDVSGSTAGIGYFAGGVGMRGDGHSFYGFVGNNDLVGESGLMFGVGGQLYLGQAVINGSAGVEDFDGANATHFSVDGAFFLNENFGLTGVASHTEFDIGGDPSWTTLGVGGVWRVTGSPTTIDLGYRKVDLDGGFEADVISLGLTLQLGTSSAQENSRSVWNGARRMAEDVLWVF